MFYAGIDAGSRAIKIVLIDENKTILDSVIQDQGVEQNHLTKELYTSLLSKNEIEKKEVAYTVGTGYGRDNLDVIDTSITEITCHARGVLHHHPDAKTIIDIGGQDSKVIRLENAKVRDFTMNDRCAAGTGRFLEVVAQRLEISISELGEFSDLLNEYAI